MLHQRWVDNGLFRSNEGSSLVELTPTWNGAPSDGRAGSHLTAPSGSPFGFGPMETNTLSGSPLTNFGSFYYGVGNLSGAWGILAPSETANIAYLVFRSDNTQNLQISVKAATPTGTPLLTPRGTELTTIDFFIPEPSTATLLSIALIAGAASFRRRRRKGEAPAEPALAQRLSRRFALPHRSGRELYIVTQDMSRVL